MIVPESYYMEDKMVRLTQSEIDIIIEELERTEHNIFIFMNYDKLIVKLKSGGKT